MILVCLVSGLQFDPVEGFVVGEKAGVTVRPDPHMCLNVSCIQ
jgi:hypothetical protein